MRSELAGLERELTSRQARYSALVESRDGKLRELGERFGLGSLVELEEEIRVKSEAVESIRAQIEGYVSELRGLLDG